MCTVTYTPTESGFIFTSNRDELKTRQTIVPNHYRHSEITLYYPKDKIAGGTWIATDGQGRLACLLNGAFDKHERKDIYIKSRGQLLLEAFEFESFDVFLEQIDLSGIEPFTLVLLEFGETKRLKEIRWDEQQMYVSEKEINGFHIWSSATLYTPEYRSIREIWFNDWLIKYREDEDYNMLNFHLQEYEENLEQGIRMTREKGMQTVSVSQITYKRNDLRFFYLDLLSNQQQAISLTNPV